jgi:hypothetical protein
MKTNKNAWSIEWYPSQCIENGTPYYVEFREVEGVRNWSLLMSNPIPIEHQTQLSSKFYHPYNLGGGPLVNDAFSMNSKEFLKFMVDALNEKHKNTI